MIHSLSGEILLAVAMPMLVVATQAVHTLRTHLITYAKARCITRMASMMVTPNEPSDEEMCALRQHYSASTLLNAVAFISEHTLGNGLNRLALIVEVCNIAYAPMRHSRLRETAILIEAYPQHAIKHLARLGTPLTWYEVATLIHIMRRAGVPIAYTPMLTSQNRNLQLIGLYLCEHFSIVDAEPHLQRLAASSDREIAYIALMTLCSVRGNISTPHVEQALSQLTPHQRLSFIRHAVQSCYSLRSCAQHLTSRERSMFKGRINSYKCRIVCN